jgi:hypothetical protein
MYVYVPITYIHTYTYSQVLIDDVEHMCTRMRTYSIYTYIHILTGTNRRYQTYLYSYVYVYVPIAYIHTYTHSQVLIGDIESAIQTQFGIHSLWRTFGGIPEGFNLESGKVHPGAEGYPLR